MVKTADYIADFIAGIGVKSIFTVAGAGNLHMLDAIRRHPDLDYICNHHEQAAAMSMYGYARAVGGLGVCLVTTGPGATNAITGVCSAWVDSIPGLVISGQVKRADTIGRAGIRQRGIQEINIIDMVRPITKYAVMLENPEDIRLELEKSVAIATSGRCGPVWLDIPMDVQAAAIDADALARFVPLPPADQDVRTARLQAQVRATIDLLRRAERPVLLAGHGIRLAGAAELFRTLLARLNIPALTTWNAIDILPSDHPLYVGRPGTYGQRGANFAIQNSDLVIAVGSRLSIPQTGYDYDLFARAAKKVFVDIDENELNKFSRRADIAIHADAGDFLRALDEAATALPPFANQDWLARCRHWRDAYPVCLDSYREPDKPVNSFDFVDVLSDLLQEGDLIVPTASGSGFTSTHQALKIKAGQRCFTSNGFAEMGFDLPGAIGACVGFGRRRIVTMTGDGGIQMNIQELQTIVHHNLPIKIFVFANDGYLTIRQTQNSLFDGQHSGSSPDCGVTLPDFARIAQAYGLPAFTIARRRDLHAGLQAVLACDGPALCVVTMQSDQALVPKSSFRIVEGGRMVSPPLEDLYPFLDRDEFLRNMLVETVRQ